MSHEYRDLKPEELEAVFSNFLLESWSYSKVSSFARNEKAFEMTYIYRIPMRIGASTVSGQACHESMRLYFSEKMKGNQQDIVNLESVAYDEIDDIKPNKWKLQKTTPTIQECRDKATDLVNKGLKNFYEDISVYESEIKEVLDVEVYFSEFLTINGVDMPLPCNGKIDLVFVTHDDKIVVLDHKFKAVYADEKELKFSIGKQAITYVNGYEEKTGIKVDEVWFVENKYSKNRDKSPQLRCFKIVIDNDTRRLYEALLYEPLKRMIEAIADPDYVYLINESDNFVDKAELYEFWAQTMIAEVDDFNIPYSKRNLIEKRLKKIRDVSIATVDPKTIKKFRANASEFIQYDLTNKDMSKQQKIEHTLRQLNLIVSVVHVIEGYSSDTFLIEVSAGTNLSAIHKHRLDIANALNVSSVRIMKNLHVYENKSYLCVEASKKRELDLMYDPSLLQGNRIPLGMDNFNNVIVWDIDNPSTPHMLICGATGSGKSVCIISTIAYAQLAGFNEIVIFDPKYEFVDMASDLITVYNDIEDIEVAMAYMVDEMNEYAKSRTTIKKLVVFDEFADAVAGSGSKYLEENLKRILQKGRSIGYRVISATQRASTKIITGDAKVNLPVQICFRVPKEVDSRVVIDEIGAESLSGKGDGLINSPEYMGVVRFQAFWKQ